MFIEKNICEEQIISIDPGSRLFYFACFTDAFLQGKRRMWPGGEVQQPRHEVKGWKIQPVLQKPA